VHCKYRPAHIDFFSYQRRSGSQPPLRKSEHQFGPPCQQIATIIGQRCPDGMDTDPSLPLNPWQPARNSPHELETVILGQGRPVNGVQDIDNGGLFHQYFHPSAAGAILFLRPLQHRLAPALGSRGINVEYREAAFFPNSDSEQTHAAG
jgi:hypothetical protein